LDRDLLVGVLSILCAACQAGHWASAAEDEIGVSTDPPDKSVSFTVDADRHDGETQLRISWNGQPSSAVLVVTIDSLEGWASRQRAMRDGLQELYGIVLVRRIGTEGDVTIEFSDTALAEILQHARAVILVQVVEELRAQFLDDWSKKGGGRVLESRRITPGDCATALRVLGGSDSPVARAFPTLQSMSFETPGRRHVRPVVSLDDLWGSLRLYLTLGGGETGEGAEP